MSGPALRKIDSHTAIHDAALQEARELTNVAENFWREGDAERALKTALIAVEHWQTRTLAHADAEEQGLYKEIAKQSESMNEKIAQLIRDHDLMRRLVSEIKHSLISDGMCEAIIKKLHALIIIDEYHNHDEMEILPDH
ncbi:Hemerythrin HHE cation binding domain-containing protein [Gracilibacillus ureilyticus]|uniref:Hemerythrin HHE cation binding domain-containing protein n=1 Tax=Gracilibacillus ureilyticus TaxID=531814 RepID=A0A1H9QU22_9BACI|nr:hemerythrin domain-containing protein [Gracilibacillus ureilyticus]SER64111.1 Hemerythrin HHE cation binding domain-containing protein [Gracilibacillus ureilyticus]